MQRCLGLSRRNRSAPGPIARRYSFHRGPFRVQCVAPAKDEQVSSLAQRRIDPLAFLQVEVDRTPSLRLACLRAYETLSHLGQSLVRPERGLKEPSRHLWRDGRTHVRCSICLGN